MKQSFLKATACALLFLLTAIVSDAYAQLFTGEMSQARKNPHYLKGAVPEENGLVVFSADIPLPAGKSEAQAFDQIKHWIGQYFTRKDAEVLSRKTLDLDSTACYVMIGINEYMVFKNTALSLDRTQFIFSLAVKVLPGKAVVKMSDISYFYEEERDPQRYTAEEWITDKACMNKKGTRLFPINGKFRIKTVDKWDGIVASIQKALAD